MGTQRKLVAIMFTDIAGYTALMLESEAKAVVIRNRHREVFDRITAAHKGRIIHYYGDGTLSIFDSSVLAVQCAIQMQSEFRTEPEIPVRIGIHSGDILITQEDIIGDAVNVASRIETLASTGSVLVSDNIVRELRSQASFSFQSLGLYHLKNDLQPREIFAVTDPALVIPERAELEGKAVAIEQASKKSNNLKLLNRPGIMIPVLILLGIGLIWIAWPGIMGLFSGNPHSAQLDTPRIAVMEFKNLTGESSQDILGDMAEDWILHGIARNKLGQVVSPQTVNEYVQTLQANSRSRDPLTTLTRYLKPTKIISGEYFRQKDQLFFQAAVMDRQIDQILFSFEPVSCALGEPLDCIELLSQRILGYFKTEQNPVVSLEEHPPKYEAYELFNRAKAMDQAGDSLYLNLLNQAIDKDPRYFEPKTYRFMYYYNAGNYPVADSLLQDLRAESTLYDRQQILLNLYQALLDGNFRNAYKYQFEEYQITPFHLETNTNMMIFSLQLINRPERVDEFYQDIDMTDMDMAICQTCVERIKIQAMAFIDQKRFADAITLLEPYSQTEGFYVLKKILMRAYARSGNLNQLNTLMQNFRIFLEPVPLAKMELFVAKELIRVDKKLEARDFLDSAIDRLQVNSPSKHKELGTCLFFRENFADAIPELLKAWEMDNTEYQLGALLAIALYRNNEIEQARSIIDRLQTQMGLYQYGDIQYALAQYYAGIDDHQLCLENLLKAVASGHWYETETFHHDPLLKEYYDTEEFDKVLSYWH